MMIFRKEFAVNSKKRKVNTCGSIRQKEEVAYSAISFFYEKTEHCSVLLSNRKSRMVKKYRYFIKTKGEYPCL